MNRAAEKKKILNLVILLTQPLAFRRRLQHGLDFTRKIEKFTEVVPHLLPAQFFAYLTEIKPKQKQHSHLCSECFGGSDADLGTSICVDDTIGLARYRG